MHVAGDRYFTQPRRWFGCVFAGTTNPAPDQRNHGSQKRALDRACNSWRTRFDGRILQHPVLRGFAEHLHEPRERKGQFLLNSDELRIPWQQQIAHEMIGQHDGRIGSFDIWMRQHIAQGFDCRLPVPAIDRGRAGQRFPIFEHRTQPTRIPQHRHLCRRQSNGHPLTPRR